MLLPITVVLITISPSLDIVSRNIWRGTDLGESPAAQPLAVVDFGSDVSASIWGSFPLENVDGATQVNSEVGWKSISLKHYHFPGRSLPDRGEIKAAWQRLLLAQSIYGDDRYSCYVEYRDSVMIRDHQVDLRVGVGSGIYGDGVNVLAARLDSGRNWWVDITYNPVLRYFYPAVGYRF